MAVPNLRKLIMAVNEEFPVLEPLATRIVTPSARGQAHDLETIGKHFKRHIRVYDTLC